MQTIRWGIAGSALDITGASGQEWHLVLDRALGAQPVKSAAWLVRDQDNPSRTYAAKCQSAADVAPLVDDAAAWRASCVSPGAAPVVELFDVFVDRSSTVVQQVVFVQEYCARGHLPRGRKISDKALLGLTLDLLDVIEVVSEASARQGGPRAHGNLSYDSLLVSGDGTVRVGGFGAKRVAILHANPDLSVADDIFDLGLVLYGIMFGKSPKESPYAVFPDNSSPYSDATIGIVNEILAPADDSSLVPPTISKIRRMAIEAGGVARSAVVLIPGATSSDTLQTNVAERGISHGSLESVEKAVEKMTEGIDAAGAYSAILSATQRMRHTACDTIFSALFRCPISRDPIVAFRAMAMIHNLMLDGPDDMLEAVRRNERFMEWTESSWTREATHAKSDPRAENSHASSFCFAGGEIAYFASFLRKKAKFHMLAAGGFTGGWQRTGAVNDEGKDVIVTRRRKVLGGMADVIEMSSELAIILAQASDVESAVKHAGIRSLVDECGRAHEAALALAEECASVASVEKLVSSYARLWQAAKNAVVAVRGVPAAGGANWEEYLAGDKPRDLVAEAEQRLEDEVIPDMNDLEALPDGAWAGGLEESKEDKAERKRQEKEERKAKRKAEKAAARAEEEQKKAEMAVSEGAMVVHGANDATTSAVATMFGDLLSLGNGQDTGKQISHEHQDERPTEGLSDATALAKAFGISPTVVGGEYLALPAPSNTYDSDGAGPDDDYDDEDGGYESYQARQEEIVSGHERRRREASTGAWAARAGYGGMALVTTNGMLGAIPGKAHPVFCQCALCQQAEAEQTAVLVASRANDGFSDEGELQSESQRKRWNYPEEKSGANVRSEARSYDSVSDDRYSGRYSPAGSYQSVECERSDGDDSGSETKQGTNERNGFQNISSPSRQKRTLRVSDDQNGVPLSHDPLQNDGPRIQDATQTAKSFRLPADLCLETKRLRLGDKVGQGSFSVVYKGEYKRQVVAIKKMHKQLQKSESAMNEFCAEVELMSRLQHPNLLCCIAASLKPPDVLLVTEFMQRGTLFDVLHRDKIRLTWALVRKIGLQVARGLAYLHSNGILHRDLKSSNLLVDGSYNVKLGDFGLSRPASGADHGQGLSGTYQYMAPEILAGEAQSTKSDVYAYGLVLWEMISGEPPFWGVDPLEAGRRVLQEGARPAIPPHCLRPYAALIQSCWVNAPAARPSIAEVERTIETTTK